MNKLPRLKSLYMP